MTDFEKFYGYPEPTDAIPDDYTKTDYVFFQRSQKILENYHGSTKTGIHTINDSLSICLAHGGMVIGICENGEWSYLAKCYKNGVGKFLTK